MRALISFIVIAALLLAPHTGTAQTPLAPAAETAAFRQLAAGIPLGTRVQLRTRDGRRLTATLMTVDADGIVVQRASRVPEPAISVRFDDLARLERVEKSGFSVGKAIGVGLAAGVGAILTIFTIAVAIDD